MKIAKISKTVTGIVLLMLALYYWYMRFDVFTHPEFYGELILPAILTILAIFLLIPKAKK